MIAEARYGSDGTLPST